MKTLRNVNPLIANFMVPETPRVVSAEEEIIIYDPLNQITIHMGGKSGPSRSSDGYKDTRDYNPSTKTEYRHNDASRYTDD